MLFTIILALLFSFFLTGLYWFITPYINSLSCPLPLSLDLAYINLQAPKGPQGQTPRYPFDTIFKDPVLHLSIVIPVKNDEKRLPAMLKALFEWLRTQYQQNNNFSSEIIVVDDASNDSTASLVLSYAHQYTSEFLRLMKLTQPMGKGGATQLGMLHARGKFILYADINATNVMPSYPALEAELLNIATKDASTGQLLGCVFGSCDSMSSLSKSTQTITSTIQSNLISFIGLPQRIDTNCGFKLFTRAATKYLALNQRLQHVGFDVELAYIAKSFKIPTSQANIQGYDCNETSQLGFVAGIKHCATLSRNIFLIHILYTSGLWNFSLPQQYTGYAISYETRVGALPLP